MNAAHHRPSALSRPSERRDDYELSQRAEYPHRWLRESDWALAEGQEPTPGAHLLTPRRGYAHHGIYVGNGRVVHYGGLAQGWQRGPVQEVSLARFAHGRPVWVRSGSLHRYGREEVVRRARSRMGENRYRLLTNNCEHFCEWCLRGEPRSEQVEYWLSHLRRMMFAVSRMLFPSLPARAVVARQA